MSSKIDRDRNRNFKKSSAFNVVDWELKKKERAEMMRNYFLPRVEQLRAYELTDWEHSFLDGLERQMNSHGNVSSKQAYFFDCMLKQYAVDKM